MYISALSSTATSSPGAPAATTRADVFGRLHGTSSFEEDVGTPRSESGAVLYADALKRLEGMGFSDTAKNLQALGRAGGQVELALDWLLAQ